MKRKSTGKKILLTVVAVALVAALGWGGWSYFRTGSAEPVPVYPFYYIGMTEYWGDSQESYGPVTTDRIQTVYLSDTQTVTEIYVQPGDTVQKGDLLMRFDTTLTDLSLERERLKVEKLKLQLVDAQERLAEINSMKPMVIPEPSDEPEKEENPGTALPGAYLISTQTQYDGSSEENAIVCWIGGQTVIDDGLLRSVWEKAVEYQTKNAQQNSAAGGESTGEDAQAFWPMFPTEPEEDPTEPSVDQPAEPTEEPTLPTVPDPTEPEPTEPTQPEPPEETITANPFYVVFKITREDMSLGDTLVWQGMIVERGDAETFRFRFFDASGIPDHTVADRGEMEEAPEIDYGSGFTAAQIAQMRSEQEKTIHDLQFSIKMAEADYKIMQTEVSDGNVYAQIDGQVVSVLTEEEAKMMMQPIVKISDGGGFFVNGSVNELEREKLQIGQEVTVNDWNTGMVYTGVIEAVGDFPSTDGYYGGMGNPNASYYSFRVFVDGSADLQEGSYVSVMYAAGVSENGIYLENPFLRTEGGRSFVYVQGADGMLEKRFVTTGKSLWGNYTEILEGLTEEDLVAFPYGKQVVEGAECVESDLSTLYG